MHSFELSKLFTDSVFAPLADSNLLRLRAGNCIIPFSIPHSFLPARMGRDLKHLAVGMFSAVFIELGQFSRESPKPFSGYY